MRFNKKKLKNNSPFLYVLQQVGCFFRVLRFHQSIKLTHDITEILLKVALHAINLNQFLWQHTITSVYKYLKLPSVTLPKQCPILQVQNVFQNN